ncbi:MAG: hypothetical protein NVSMB52_01310 [Chloroflexota bacterium]
MTRHPLRDGATRQYRRHQCLPNRDPNDLYWNVVGAGRTRAIDVQIRTEVLVHQMEVENYVL